METRIAEIALRGDAGSYHDAISSIVAPLQVQGPLSAPRTRRALRQIEALPGITSHASFKPNASALNAHTLVLKLNYRPCAVP